MIHDGLWDPYNNQHMGMCAEKCAKDFSIRSVHPSVYVSMCLTLMDVDMYCIV